MNPALPVLGLLSLAGLLLRRREIGIPWAACGLAGMVLLAPALSLSDGVPSPAATLAQDAPWQGVADPRAGNPNLRDVSHQVEPWLLFLRHELRAGRLPFWDPHQFSGSPYWSNGSGAPLFPLHLLFAALPLRIGLVLLPWLRLVIGGCGAWLLGRELGLGREAATLSALAYPLSGMIVSFLLFPMGNCHALVPWVLLAVERLASGRGGWPGLMLAGGLQLLGGHPETAVFTALLAGLYLLVRGTRRPRAAWLGFLGGWVGALALAAVQLLPLFYTVRESGKWLHAEAGAPPSLATVGTLLLRLILPDALGNPARGTWWGPYNFAGTALYVGAIPLVLALVGLGWALLPPLSGPGSVSSRWRRGRSRTEPDLSEAGGRVIGPRPQSDPTPQKPSQDRQAPRDRRWIALAAMTLFALVGAYHLPGARQLLLALPIVGRGIHHYLKFGVELGLALFAGLGLERWLAGARRTVVAGAALVAILLMAAWWRLGGEWSARGLTSGQAAWTLAALAAIVLLLGAVLLSPRRRAALVPLLLALVAVDLAAAHAAVNPGLAVSRLYPETGAIRFLTGRPERFAGSGTALHPDAAMVYGLYDVRGDSPVKMERYDRVYGRFAAPDPVYFQPIRDWSSPWLDRLGVRWVVVPPGEAPPQAPWRLAYDGRDARIFERPGALALVRWAGGAGEGGAEKIQVEGRGSERLRAPEAGETGGELGRIRVEKREPGRWQVSWSGAPGAWLVVAESWDAGWRAWVDGRPARLAAASGLLLAVAVPEGSKSVELRYRPQGIEAGAAASLAALLALGAAAWHRRRAQPVSPSPPESPLA
jgi:hypothetical protein